MDARKSLTAAFSGIPDPRRKHLRLHNLIDILAIAVCATFAGADGCRGLVQYGRSKRKWLKTFLQLPHGIPSHDTFLRVLGAIDPLAFQRSFAAWLEAVKGKLAGRSIALDGKAVRAAARETATGCLTLVNAWDTTRGMALGQVSVPEGSSEKAVWTELLGILYLEDAVVTLDAGGCTRAVADKIVEKGGDYLLAVKGNQKALLASAEALLERGLDTAFRGMKVDRHEESDSGHGRSEERRTMVISNPKGLPKAWSDAKCLVVVNRERRVGDGPGAETMQFYVGSRRERAKRVAGRVRGHWLIEGMHWSLDVSFGEDANKTASRAGENLAWIRRIGLSLLKAEPSELSIKNKRLRCGWDDDYLLDVLKI